MKRLCVMKEDTKPIFSGSKSRREFFRQMQKKKGLAPSLLFLSLIFFTKPGHPEEIKKFRPILSLRLIGELGLVAVGDINKVLGSVNNNETFRYWREHDPKYIMGEIKRLNSWTLDGEAELRIDLTPRIGFGIAASGPSFQRSGESSLTYTYPGSHGPQVHTFTYKTEIEASMPIKL